MTFSVFPTKATAATSKAKARNLSQSFPPPPGSALSFPPLGSHDSLNTLTAVPCASAHDV
jgi:hypothetical protein